jgi:hypothetical protein
MLLKNKCRLVNSVKFQCWTAKEPKFWIAARVGASAWVDKIKGKHLVLVSRCAQG